MQRRSFTIFADYFQFYLWDKEARSTAPVDYSEEDVRRRIKPGKNVLVIQPVRNMTVPVEFEIHDSDPGFSADDWDHIAECSLDLPSGRLEVHECVGRSIAQFEVTPGMYRVRALFGNLGELSEDGLDGNDHYKVTLWPEGDRSVRIVKQWSG